jgi:hypothetical protein
MRSVLGQGTIVGVGVGAAVLIIRGTLSAAPLHVQLLAVLCAGIILAAFQLALGRRLGRPRRLAASREPLAPALPAPVPPAASQLTPAETLDERDRDWTGLAATALPAESRASATEDPLAAVHGESAEAPPGTGVV